jgi:hypothetical protein
MNVPKNMISEIISKYNEEKEKEYENEKDKNNHHENIDDENNMKPETSLEIKNQVMEMMTHILKKKIREKKAANIDEYKKYCMERFTNFHQRYPTLFFSIIENPSSFPLYRLDEMLNLKMKIENKEVSEEKISVQLGQKYYNEFVKDTVSELDKNLKK